MLSISFNHPCTVCGVIGRRRSSVARIDAGAYQERKRGFSLILACRSEQKPTYNSSEWTLQIKIPGRRTDYNQYASKMMNQPAVSVLNVFIGVVLRRQSAVTGC